MTNINIIQKNKWSSQTITKDSKMPEDEVRMDFHAKRKHNYPKTRKKAIYKNTQKYYLLQSYPESYIKETWIKHGQYKGSDFLNCSPKVLWHLAKEKGWKRPLPDHLVLVSRTGTWKISENYYIKGEINV